MLRELARGPWVLGYANADDLAARLDGVRARVGLERVPNAARPSLLAVLGEALGRADAALDAVLALKAA
jgi:hypothetical protein